MTRIGRHLVAVLRGLALVGVGLLAAAAALIQLIVFVPGFGLGMIFLLTGPVRLARRVPVLARRLADRWSGIPVGEPYRPAPPPPVPGPDGRYVRDRQLYRRPTVPAFLARLDWLIGDLATWRDLRWMLVEPVLGTVLAGGPAALLLGGVGFAVTRSGADWWAAPVGVLAALAGVALAPTLLRAHAHWTAFAIGPKVPGPAAIDRRRWLGERFLVLCKLLVLLGLTLLGVPLAVLTLLGVALTGLVGLVPVFPLVTEHFRWLVNLRRRLAGDWAGSPVVAPYLPRPELPERRADGFFAVGRNLYQSPRAATYRQRQRWLWRDPATWRDLAFQLTDPLVGGVLVAVPVGLVGYGFWGLLLPRLLGTLGIRDAGLDDWYGSFAGSAVAAVPVGVALTVAGVLIAPAVLRLHGRWTRLLLGPTERSRLALRVRRLTEHRADEAQQRATELRRIERDLHDGTQARLVAMGLTLGTIESLLDRDPEAARALLRQARASSAQALAELRDLVRGIHPPVLAERGLADALRALALDVPVPVHTSVEVTEPLDPAVESTVYFAVQELLTNVLKHAHATRVELTVRSAADRVRVVVRDDGQGGADADGGEGSGLRGLAHRLATFDGTVLVDSPPGGPTEVILEVPCGSSSPKTSTC